MLVKTYVSRVVYDQKNCSCTILLQNGDVIHGEELYNKEQLANYIRILEEEDDLVFPDSRNWEYIVAPEAQRLRVQCFGNFEVFYRDVPIHFERQGAKELFAFLVDKRGASSNRVQICNAMWEDDQLIERRKAYFRTLILSLRTTLKKYDFEDVFINRRDEYAINTSLVDCDYYRYLKGDKDGEVRFRGEYMTQYSWAESTLGQLIKESDYQYYN